MHGFRDIDAPWVGKAFKSGSYIHSIAIDLVAIDNHIAEIDADSKLNFSLIGEVFATGLEVTLNYHRARQGIHHTGEFC